MSNKRNFPFYFNNFNLNFLIYHLIKSSGDSHWFTLYIQSGKQWKLITIKRSILGRTSCDRKGSRTTPCTSLQRVNVRVTPAIGSRSPPASSKRLLPLKQHDSLAVRGNDKGRLKETQLVIAQRADRGQEDPKARFFDTKHRLTRLKTK